MTKKEFWDLIEQIRLNYHDSGEDFIFTIDELFADFSEEQVAYFKAYLKAYMSAHESVWLLMAAKIINEYVTDDSLLYFTLWLLSQGEEVFLSTLKNPDNLANLADIPWQEAEFELLSAAGYQFTIPESLTRQVNQSSAVLGIVDDLVYKNEAKDGNYENVDVALADLATIFPNLIARRKAEGHPLTS